MATALRRPELPCPWGRPQLPRWASGGRAARVQQAVAGSDEGLLSPGMSPPPRKAQTLFSEKKIAVLPCSWGRDYVVGCHHQRSQPSRPAQGRDRSCKGIPQTGCACFPTRARGVCVPRRAQMGTERTLPAPTHICTPLAALLFLSWCCHKLSYC